MTMTKQELRDEARKNLEWAEHHSDHAADALGDALEDLARLAVMVTTMPEGEDLSVEHVDGRDAESAERRHRLCEIVNAASKVAYGRFWAKKAKEAGQLAAVLQASAEEPESCKAAEVTQ